MVCCVWYVAKPLRFLNVFFFLLLPPSLPPSLPPPLSLSLSAPAKEGIDDGKPSGVGIGHRLSNVPYMVTSLVNILGH
jgi:hypothetical protein